MEYGDSLNVQKSNTRVSMKSKISKVAEFWGAETPFANLGREDANGMENGNAVSYFFYSVNSEIVNHDVFRVMLHRGDPRTAAQFR
jgi:hypothetical protein